MTHPTHTLDAFTRRGGADRRLLHRSVQMTLPFFLAAVACRRLLAPARGQAARTPRPTLLQEARAKAYATIPFIFMG